MNEKKENEVTYELCFEYDNQYFIINIKELDKENKFDFSKVKAIDTFTSTFEDEFKLKKFLVDNNLLLDFNTVYNLCIVKNKNGNLKKIFNGEHLIFEDEFYKYKKSYFETKLKKYENIDYIKHFIKIIEKKYISGIPLFIKTIKNTLGNYSIRKMLSNDEKENYNNAVDALIAKELEITKKEKKYTNYENLHSYVIIDQLVKKQLEKEEMKELYIQNKKSSTILEQDILNVNDENDYTIFDEQLETLYSLYGINSLEEVRNLEKSDAFSFMAEYDRLNEKYKRIHKM